MKNKNIDDLFKLMNSLDFAIKEPFFSDKRVVIDKVATRCDIKNVQNSLNIKFPKSYIDFNTKSPWYWFDCACNYIINPLNHSENFVYPVISEINKWVREKEFYKYLNGNEEICYFEEKIPDFLIVFDSSASIDGDYLCFDTRFYKDFPIVHWSVGSNLYKKYFVGNVNENDIVSIEHPYFIYPNFSTYMYYKIRDCLDYDYHHPDIRTL